MKLYTLKCPVCKKVANHQLAERTQVKCGDCLMDRCEVVTMEVVKREGYNEHATNEN